MLGNIALAVFMVVGYLWWAFVRLPQKNEEKRQNAIATLGVATEAWATPYGMDKTKEMENVQKTVRADMGFPITSTPMTTPTPYPTKIMTAFPSPTNTPTEEIGISARVTIHPTMTPMNEFDGTYEEIISDRLVARVSYYWPPLCGTAADPDCINGDHDLFRTSTGDEWVSKVMEGWRIVACPYEFPIGQKILVFDEVYVCMDRGGAIAYNDIGNYYWLDFLMPNMPAGIPNEYWGLYTTFYLVD